MRSRALVLAVLMTLLWAAPASAHHSPANCSSNEFTLSISRDRTSGVYANGETISYTVKVSNVGATACDVDGLTISMNLPAADGTPTGSLVTLATNAPYPAGTTERTVSVVPYKIAVNPGVTDAVASVQVTAGLLHDTANDHPLRLTKEIGTQIVPPVIDLKKTGSITGGVAPQTVTYTYTVTNISAIAI